MIYEEVESRDAGQSPSATELAMGEFLERVCTMEGVTVRRCGSESLADQTIVVEVPSILSEEARLVCIFKGRCIADTPVRSSGSTLTK